MRSVFVFGITFIFFGIAPLQSWAKEFPVTARLFVGIQSIDPENLNTEMAAESLETFDQVSKLGVEATYPIAKHLDFGFRYAKLHNKLKENPDNPATEYSGEISQDSVSLILRLPLVRTNLIRGDFFAGVGGTNTTFKLKTASQDGTLDRKGSDGWFGTPVTVFGGSVGVGYKSFYFVVEGGIETNKVDKFERSGTVGTNIDTIDLSGSYITIGLLFDGVKATK